MYSTCTRIWPKNRTFAVASVQVAVGWVLVRRFRIFSGQCIRIYSVRVYDIAQCSPVVLAQWTHDIYSSIFGVKVTMFARNRPISNRIYRSCDPPPHPSRPHPITNNGYRAVWTHFLHSILYTVHCVQDTNIIPAYGTQSTTNIAITIGPFEELL